MCRGPSRVLGAYSNVPEKKGLKNNGPDLPLSVHVFFTYVHMQGQQAADQERYQDIPYP